jgi:hypothetical protein
MLILDLLADFLHPHQCLLLALLIASPSVTSIIQSTGRRPASVGLRISAWCTTPSGFWHSLTYRLSYYR